jgi:hypothetical protein
MENHKSPRPHTEVINELKDDMLKRYPNSQDQELIISYAENSPKVIEMLVERGRDIDQICAYFDDLDKHFPENTNQKLKGEIWASRVQIGNQIRLGRIYVLNLKIPSDNDQPSNKSTQQILGQSSH